MSTKRRIAYWMTERKSQKLNWKEFHEVCERNGFELFKLDFDTPLEDQGPFSIFLHKMSDVITKSDLGDQKCTEMLSSLHAYAAACPSLVILDPIDNVRLLLNRCTSYRTIQSLPLASDGVFTPDFCEISACDTAASIRSKLSAARVHFPLICKPLTGHGSKKAHEMALVFSEAHLEDVRARAPCVAQTFVNHNAALFKVYVVGEEFCCVRRPSVKNLEACAAESICFDSGISKAGARSELSLLDEEVAEVVPDQQVLRRIAEGLRRGFGMDLLGVDVVVENTTGRYGVIDVNSYPSYDGFPNFFEALIRCLSRKLENSENSENSRKTQENRPTDNEKLINAQ